MDHSNKVGTFNTSKVPEIVAVPRGFKKERIVQRHVDQVIEVRILQIQQEIVEIPSTCTAR